MKFVLVLLLFVIHSAWSKDLTEAYYKGKDITLLSQLQEIRKYKVIVVPGVLAESFQSKSDNQVKLSALFSEAFGDQIELLKTLKIEYEFVQLETENSPEANAQKIIEAIENSTRPVLIYSHSKGGLDTLEAIRQKPSLLSRIHGWASIQSPFWGSPVASAFNNNTVLRKDGDFLFEWMGGSSEGMSSLSTEERLSYMEKISMRDLINMISAKIRFINYASYKINVFGIDTPLELLRNFTDEKSGVNDGVVPLSSALMMEHGFDIDYIIEPDVDHLMTMSHYYLSKDTYNRKFHTISVLKQLL